MTPQEAIAQLPANVYVGCATAVRNGVVYNHPQVHTAGSQDQAVGIAYAFIAKRYPANDGWSHHVNMDHAPNLRWV